MYKFTQPNQNSKWDDSVIIASLYGTKEELHSKLNLIFKYMGISIDMVKKVSGKFNDPELRFTVAQIMEIKEELDKGEERRHDGKTRVYFTLSKTLKDRWDDYLISTESAELSAAIGVEIPEFLIFICRCFIFKLVPDIKPLSKLVDVFSYKKINPNIDVPIEEYVSARITKAYYSDLVICKIDSPDSYIQLEELNNRGIKVVGKENWIFFRLKIISGLSHKEVAKLYGITIDYSKNKLYRIKNKLKEDPVIASYLQ